MKITTLIKIYDIVENDGYITKLTVCNYKDFGYLELNFERGDYKETLYSSSYKIRYILQKLNGRRFENKEIKGCK